MKHTLQIILALGLFLLLGTPAAHAARIYLQSSQTEYKQGDTFAVDIRINIEGECLNAFEVGISFDQALLNSVEFSRGNSILTLWPIEPSFDNTLGTVSFAGGLPGGYCGRVPGDPELTNLLGVMYFTVPPSVDSSILPKTTEISFLSNTVALRNDGLGTPAQLSSDALTLTARTRSEQDPLKNELYDLLIQDAAPPEPFFVEILKDPSVYEGKYFIVFSTTDKQSGIRHYEVLETTSGGFFPNSFRKAVWQKANSPYLLRDQTLQNNIKIKAVDNAGNERIVEFAPPAELRSIESGPSSRTAVFTILFLAGIGLFLLWRHRRKNH